MIPAPVIAAGIGAAGNLIGGLIGKAGADDAANKAWRRNKQVLQKQVRWRVEDSVAAGLHPLAALGMSPAAGPAASVGGEILGQGISDMGQNIGRAAEAMMTPQDKVGSRIMELQAERGKLENELLRSQIASQRMRNMQQATPGVSGSGTKTILPVPGLDEAGKKGWKVTYPGLGEEAEKHYSDIGGNVFGAGGLALDALKYLGYERTLSDLSIPMSYGEKYGRAVREWILRNGPRKPLVNGGAGW